MGLGDDSEAYLKFGRAKSFCHLTHLITLRVTCCRMLLTAWGGVHRVIENEDECRLMMIRDRETTSQISSVGP